MRPAIGLNSQVAVKSLSIHRCTLNHENGCKAFAFTALSVVCLTHRKALTTPQRKRKKKGFKRLSFSVPLGRKEFNSQFGLFGHESKFPAG
jgi:hypothetical protein